MKIPIALRNNEYVYIYQLTPSDRGDKCGCVCPDCHSPLRANMGDKKTHYFSHKLNKNCHAEETVVHLFAKNVLLKNKILALPSYSVYREEINDAQIQEFMREMSMYYYNQKERVVSFFDVKEEQSILGTKKRPDVTAYEYGSDCLYVEFLSTHKKNDEDCLFFQNIDATCVEIDLKDFQFSFKSLEDDEILMQEYLNTSSHCKWISYSKKRIKSDIVSNSSAYYKTCFRNKEKFDILLDFFSNYVESGNCIKSYEECPFIYDLNKHYYVWKAIRNSSWEGEIKWCTTGVWRVKSNVELANNNIFRVGKINYYLSCLASLYCIDKGHDSEFHFKKQTVGFNKKRFLHEVRLRYCEDCSYKNMNGCCNNSLCLAITEQGFIETSIDNGCLYTKDFRELLFVPQNVEYYTIKEGTYFIASGAFSKADRIKRVCLPSTIIGIDDIHFLFNNKIVKRNMPSENFFIHDVKVDAIYWAKKAQECYEENNILNTKACVKKFSECIKKESAFVVINVECKNSYCRSPLGFCVVDSVVKTVLDLYYNKLRNHDFYIDILDNIDTIKLRYV